MRRLLCWIGWHRYSWVKFNHTTELWACRCGRVVIQFSDDQRALSEVGKLNEWWKQSKGNHVGH